MHASPQFQFRIHRQDYSRYVHLHCYIEGPRGEIGILTETPQFTACKPDDQILSEPATPLLNLNEADCQALAEELWRAGFRPRESHGSAGEIGAVRTHLEHVSGLLAQVIQPVINQANAATLALAAPHTTAQP
jgi:hypothetical protein